MLSYTSEDIQAAVFYDGCGHIEYIYMRLSAQSRSRVSASLRKLNFSQTLTQCAELFIQAPVQERRRAARG